MRQYYIIHFGIGNVGKTLIEQLFTNKDSLKRRFAVDLQYCGMFGSKGGFYKKTGFSKSEVKKNMQSLSAPLITEPLDFLKKLPSFVLQNTIIVDTTTSGNMFKILEFALKNCAYAVLSNKKPLAGTQKEFADLQKLGGNHFKYETTVGAGLPIIKVLQELLATGDDIVEISGCFSGTLGFLCSELEKGKPFSKIVAIAKEKGFTESDPREDLSGMDVARKAIIIARLLGKQIEMKNLSVSALFPDSYSKLTISDFMKKTHELDRRYEKLFKDAAKKNMTLRYVATVSKKKVLVCLKEVLKNSPLGSLKGPDNMIVFRTKRYYDNSMVIQGPGAGLEVTAAGVFGDILAVTTL